MTEPHEFGGPINRPAHNARQITPGEAQSPAPMSGDGGDFLGLNEEVLAQPGAAPAAPHAMAAPAPAPASREESWLLEMNEPATRGIAPAPRIEAELEPTPSATASSLLNATWREETPAPRKSRWLVPVAGGAALVALAIVGVPMLSKSSKPNAPLPEPRAQAPRPLASSTPADPSDGAAHPSPAYVESALAENSGPEPVAADPRLDFAASTSKPTPPVASGRRETRVEVAPAPGSSFVAPVQIDDPSGIWTVAPSASDDGDVDTQSSELGADNDPFGPAGASHRAAEPDVDSGALVAGIVGECNELPEREMPARRGELGMFEAQLWLHAAAAAREPKDGSRRGRKQASRTQETPVDPGIARALAAWSGGKSENEAAAVVDAPQTVELAEAEAAPDVNEFDVATNASDRESASDEHVEVASTPVVETVASIEPAPAIELPPAVEPSTDHELAQVDDAADARSSARADLDAAGAATDVAIVDDEALAAEEPTGGARVLARARRNADGAASRSGSGRLSRREARRRAALGEGDELESVDEFEGQGVAAQEPTEQVADVATGAEDSGSPEMRAPAVIAQVDGAVEVAIRSGEATEAEAPATEVVVASPVDPSGTETSTTPTPTTGEVASDDTTSSEVAASGVAASGEGATSTEAPLDESAPTVAATTQAPTTSPAPTAPAVEATVAPTVEQIARLPVEPAAEVPVELPLEPAIAAPAPQAPLVVEGESAELPPSAGDVHETSKPRKSSTPERVLRVATDGDMERVWRGEEIPLEAIGSKTRVATPDIGAARVTFATGEIFEGELVALGEGSVWLRTKHGQLGLDGARVKTVSRIDPGASMKLGGPGSQKLGGMPRARVRTAGGVLYGKILERNEKTTTLVTDAGGRLVLDSANVELLAEQPKIQIKPSTDAPSPSKREASDAKQAEPKPSTPKSAPRTNPNSTSKSASQGEPE